MAVEMWPKRSIQPCARDESGFAMLVVIGVVSMLTLVAMSALVLSQQAVTGMERSIKTQVAFQAANAGIDRAFARLDADPTGGFSWPLAGSVGGAAYSVAATLSPGSISTTYTVTSTGTYGGTTQTVSQQYARVDKPPFDFWNKYVFTDGGYAGVNGWSTTSFWGPVFAAGDFSVAGLGGLPSSVSEFAITNSVYVNNGQMYCKKGVDSTYATMNLLANAPQTAQNPISGGGFASWSPDCPQVTRPTFGVAELQAEWTTATPEGRVPTSAPFPTTLTRGTHPLTITPSTATTTFCVVDGTTKLKWTKNGGNASKGLLTVDGVVYIDGDLELPECNYTGRGTLVVRGDVTLEGSLLPKAGELLMNTPPRYNPLSPAEVIGIITPFNMSCDPGPGNNAMKAFMGDFGMAGAFYVGQVVSFESNNNRIKGVIMANGCNANGHNVDLIVDPDMPSYLPPDMPGRDGLPASVGVQRLYRTWSRM